MSVELCRTRTSDGLLLCGLLTLPEDAVQPTLPVDAFLLVHGTAGNFYAAGILETFAKQAVAFGAAVLRVNTRGHDRMAAIPGERDSVAGGAAYECIAECCFDVTAWADLLADRGLSRIALVGHSMGAVKSIFSQARAAHQSVRCVIGISPPRFCHARLASGRGGDEFIDDYRRACEFVEIGRGSELITVRYPLPLMLTADGFLAKYGPHDDYDIVRHLPDVACPTLIVLGTGSVAASSAFAGLPEEIQRLAVEHSQLALELVEAADTVYSTCEDVPFVRAAAWLVRSHGA
jgi:pimeloyl-ACP methyl ester carboxylesterase